MYYVGGMMELPHRESMIWRYTDVTKLLSLIDSRSLYFASILKMDDLYEGYVPLPTFEEYRDYRLYEEAYANVQPEDVRCLYDDHVKSTKELRKMVFVNCWHINEGESAAMWKLYLSSTEGIAIRSTVDRLIHCFDKTETTVLIGKVKYIEYNQYPLSGNIFERIIHKRRSFAHEQELRAVVRDKEIEGKLGSNEEIEVKPGMNVPVDLDTLIESIWVAPTCQGWIRELLVSILKRYGIKKEVHQSSLKGGPLW